MILVSVVLVVTIPLQYILTPWKLFFLEPVMNLLYRLSEAEEYLPDDPIQDTIKGIEEIGTPDLDNEAYNYEE